jgi:hypothetical protein
MMSENAKCPFCESEPEEHDNHLWLSCSNNDCLLSRILFTPKDWDTRPLESALLQRAEKAEAKRDAAIAENARLRAALRETIEVMANSAYKAEILFLQTGIVGFSEIEIALKVEIAKAKEVLCE